MVLGSKLQQLQLFLAVSSFEKIHLAYLLLSNHYSISYFLHRSFHLLSGHVAIMIRIWGHFLAASMLWLTISNPRSSVRFFRFLQTLDLSSIFSESTNADVKSGTTQKNLLIYWDLKEISRKLKNIQEFYCGSTIFSQRPLYILFIKGLRVTSAKDLSIQVL